MTVHVVPALCTGQAQCTRRSALHTGTSLSRAGRKWARTVEVVGPVGVEHALCRKRIILTQRARQKQICLRVDRVGKPITVQQQALPLPTHLAPRLISPGGAETAPLAALWCRTCSTGRRRRPRPPPPSGSGPPRPPPPPAAPRSSTALPAARSDRPAFAHALPRRNIALNACWQARARARGAAAHACTFGAPLELKQCATRCASTRALVEKI